VGEKKKKKVGFGSVDEQVGELQCLMERSCMYVYVHRIFGIEVDYLSIYMTMCRVPYITYHLLYLGW
jgi:hypothetical protein